MKRFVVGLIFGASLMISMNASAEVVNYVGKMIEGQFTVKVDGKEVQSPGIVIDGTSYLPTRAIAEIAGFDVSFNGDEGIELKKKEIEPVYIPIYIEPESKSSQQDNISPEERLKIIQGRLDAINSRIQSTVRAIRFNEDILKNPNGNENDKKLVEEALPKMREQLNALLDEKSKLEAEKAELEAQLNAQ